MRRIPGRSSGAVSTGGSGKLGTEVILGVILPKLSVDLDLTLENKKERRPVCLTDRKPGGICKGGLSFAL